ncbi:anthranilate/para-aminobenzoate synthase component I [Belliella baltica DSM 15883]|uniref:Anthranilate/para-aminobenzoate synthase component I n=1 Tax=Belliella baltica (strain DSM 15883 / CIP 108006 / LMG 21964 / BA134) TaxID=866536 RepID=I3Z9P0_BELBD|nr:anthranilate synthase component I family protein [Belliella baltica]AFL85958.1 anthranilate/para-aminobenzoate synthase component I [Belliella baltica DSM 15883]
MIQTFPISENSKSSWLQKLLYWADTNYPYFAFFDDHQVEYPQEGFQKSFYAAKKSIPLERAFELYRKDELVGILSYDYKNKIEKLSSQNQTIITLPESVFFIPELKIQFEVNKISIESSNPEKVFEEVTQVEIYQKPNPFVEIQPQTSKDEYEKAVHAIQKHIVEGDIYEMNYCMSFSFDIMQWNPIFGYLDLIKKSPMPFTTLFKAEEKYLICASPERFLKKEGKKMIAQPIKGTIKRGADAQQDELLKAKLFESEKERAENLMIVDLMRNDLSKISETGSVKVDELFGVYAFPKVFQMISTVSSTCREDLGLKDLFHATFPMGSMTGAPKIKCMQLIEYYESFQRAWFSGTVGHISENGDLDFNVIIRSILFDKTAQKGFFAVGSAITFDADASYEYEECLLKASAIIEMLSGKSVEG